MFDTVSVYFKAFWLVHVVREDRSVRFGRRVRGTRHRGKVSWRKEVGFLLGITALAAVMAG